MNLLPPDNIDSEHGIALSRITMKQYKYLLVAFLVLNSFQQAYGKAKNDGKICISYVLSKALNEPGWEKRQFLQVDGSEKISFEGMPKVVFENLDRSKKHKTIVFWDNEQVSSWWFRFPPDTQMMQLYFRPGSWHLDPLPSGICKGDS